MMPGDLILVNQRLPGIILAWRQEHLKSSPKTESTYAPMLETFRAFLLEHGLDLDAPARDVAYHAQAWAALPHQKTGKAVTPSTHNLRLAAISSFYEYAIRHDEMAGPNPMERVKRLKREQYKGAKAMPFLDGEMDAAIDAIPATTLSNIRDRALLSLALYTGRRLSEVADLRCVDVEMSPSQMTVFWQHVKGGDSAKNVLPAYCPAVTHMKRWLKRYYGAHPAADNLVFPALSRNNEGGRMTARGIQQRAERWLPTGGKFHALRHTFAMAMHQSGATVLEIKEALGHKNVATTSAYLEKLGEGENTHIDDLIAVYAGKKGKRK